jgi:predicted helicase
MRSFEQIYVLELHGNANKKERAPDGGQYKNVFDIRQGVAVSLFIKRTGLETGVWRGDIWGDRLLKYKLLAAESFDQIDWDVLMPRSPQYLFKALPENANYDNFLSIPNIFVKSSVGVVTGRDEIAIQYSIADMLEIATILSQGRKRPPQRT